jgi:hypothetical protein
MTGGGSIFRINAVEWLGKSTDVAVIVTIVSVVTTAGARKFAVVLLVCVRVPIPAGDAPNTTPPLVTVSFSTPAVIETMPPWPTKAVPLGDIVTEWKLFGVSAQLESCSTAIDISESKYECRAQVFMAPPQGTAEMGLPESPTLLFRHESGRA